MNTWNIYNFIQYASIFILSLYINHHAYASALIFIRYDYVESNLQLLLIYDDSNNRSFYVCTQEEQRAIIQFLRFEWVSKAGIYTKLLAQCSFSTQCVQMSR